MITSKGNQKTRALRSDALRAAKYYFVVVLINSSMSREVQIIVSSCPCNQGLFEAANKPHFLCLLKIVED
jgi:hypothetical protein